MNKENSENYLNVSIERLQRKHSVLLEQSLILKQQMQTISLQNERMKKQLAYFFGHTEIPDKFIDYARSL